MLNSDRLRRLDDACLPYEKKNLPRREGEFERLVDCIECGLCISACPSALTSSSYLGPAVIAAAEQRLPANEKSAVDPFCRQP